MQTCWDVATPLFLSNFLFFIFFNVGTSLAEVLFYLIQQFLSARVHIQLFLSLWISFFQFPCHFLRVRVKSSFFTLPRIFSLCNKISVGEIRTRAARTPCAHTTSRPRRPPLKTKSYSLLQSQKKEFNHWNIEHCI